MPRCFSTQCLASRDARHSKDHYCEVLSCELQAGLGSFKSFPCGHWIHGHHAVTSFILPPGCGRNSKQPRRGRSKPICHVKKNCSSLFHFFLRLAFIFWANDCLLKALWWSSHWPRVSTLLPPVISLIMSKNKTYTTEVFLPLSLKRPLVEEYSLHNSVPTNNNNNPVVVFVPLFWAELTLSWRRTLCQKKKKSFHWVANCMNGSSNINTWLLQTEQTSQHSVAEGELPFCSGSCFEDHRPFFKWPTEIMTLHPEKKKKKKT